MDWREGNSSKFKSKSRRKRKMNKAEITALVEKLAKLPEEKLRLFDQAIEEISEPKIKEIKTFDSWDSPDKVVKQTTITGSNGETLIFNWKPLSVDDKFEIDKLCEPPIPTTVNPLWKTLPTDPNTGKIRPGQEIPDYSNPEYIRYVMNDLKLDEKKMLLTVVKCLIMDIPGETLEEKANSLKQKCLKEVEIIYSHMWRLGNIDIKQVNFI